MNNYPELYKTLQVLSEFVKEDYQKKLKELRPHQNGKSYDTYASGKLYNSTNCIVNETPNGFQVYFSAIDYWINVENGRKPGKGIPLNVLDKWVIDRNIQPYDGMSENSMKYLINRSIKQNGIKPQPMLRELQDNLLTDWGKLLQDAFENDMKNIVKDKIKSVLNT